MMKNCLFLFITLFSNVIAQTCEVPTGLTVCTMVDWEVSSSIIPTAASLDTGVTPLLAGITSEACKTAAKNYACGTAFAKCNADGTPQLPCKSVCVAAQTACEGEPIAAAYSATICDALQTTNCNSVSGGSDTPTGGDPSIPITKPVGGDPTKDEGGDSTEEEGGDPTKDEGGDSTEEEGGDSTKDNGADTSSSCAAPKKSDVCTMVNWNVTSASASIVTDSAVTAAVDVAKDTSDECQAAVKTYMCALTYPKCVPDSVVPQLPCKDICVAAQTACEGETVAGAYSAAVCDVLPTTNCISEEDTESSASKYVPYFFVVSFFLALFC